MGAAMVGLLAQELTLKDQLAQAGVAEAAASDIKVRDALSSVHASLTCQRSSIRCNLNSAGAAAFQQILFLQLCLRW